MRDILFVAGEASGDQHTAGVAAELRKRRVPYGLVGVGGGEMSAAGVTLLTDLGKGAVMGFAEVLAHVPRHWMLLRRIKRRLRSGKVGLVILVDYPGFNMKVAAAAKAAGIPVLYYITPQVWAWGANRLERLAELVTRAAVILPFEESLLRSHGINATFVGHPLLDCAPGTSDRRGTRQTLGVGDGERLLALFPGSRAQEIARHLDVFVATAVELQHRMPDLRIVLRAAPNVDIDPRRCPFPIDRSSGLGQSLRLLGASDAALCKSGTTTLEAAVAGCPLIVAYRTSALTYFAARRLVRIPDIGLVNVVAGSRIAPEFVQGQVQPRVMADALQPLLDPKDPRRAAMISSLAQVRAALGSPGAARRVAEIAVSLI